MKDKKLFESVANNDKDEDNILEDDDNVLIDHQIPSGSNNEPQLLINVGETSVNEENEEETNLRRRKINDPASSIYESLDYDVCENKLWRLDQKTPPARFTLRKNFARLLIFIIIGILTALVACSIDVVIEKFSGYKYDALKRAVDSNILAGNLTVPYIYWLLSSIIPVMIGAAAVTYIEPITAGSGIPIVKCYLNGVKVPRIVRVKTLIVKAFGVVTSVVGGLAGGKEGPMIHAGAVVAAGVSQGKSTTLNRDLNVFKYFRDDHEKRDFVLGGAAAGVGAAFGAPIGGVLFSLEEAASFWNQNLILRTLIASTISSFTLSLVLSAYHGLQDFTFNGLFNLGKFESLHFEYFELPIFILMGVIGGLFGASWNSINTKVNRFRARFIQKSWAKVVEAGFVAAIGVTAAACMMYLINDCRPLGNDPTEYPVQLFCEDTEYNVVAALWFQTPEATVKSLLHDPPGSHKIFTLAIFFVIYFILSCITYGLNVSLGIFIPTVLTGAAWGRLLGMLIYYFFPEAGFLVPGKYALIGAAAQLGGVLRMTISLSVILIETTGVETSFTFPLVITLVTAKWIGDYFNEGIYDSHIKVNHVPMLTWDPPKIFDGVNAEEIMSRNVVCFNMKEKARHIYEVLKNCKHNGFPVVEKIDGDNRTNGRLCGIILRYQLIVILLQGYFEENRRSWEKVVNIQDFRNYYPRFPSIEDVKFNRHDKEDFTVNMEIFLNPSPVRINECDSVPRIFGIFRALALRHMIVVNKDNVVSGIITRRDFLVKEN
ncbi:H(+)/Cl(-) exchange transporter 7 [Condylostylus longicornis]|uniref:H(+)/Cl(-) exchange transporter 7 n=1 Tax=Condylostylus longicornis TaxID=2530218 RepID=UPI00244DEB6E|nr:H(+)/Cl(-) exchange transporter 7 [Condylostylus longicornis]